VFAAKPRAGCHEAARLPVSEALDATSKVALSVSADKSGEILPPSSAVSSSLIDAQPVRQLPALQKNTWHDTSCSIEAVPSYISSTSATLPCCTAEAGRTVSSTICTTPNSSRNRKVHFTRAGALRDDTGPAPMASTLNCTNKFTVPPRAVEASRSLPTSASILTNTARAASALHYTGKATPPAHLAENNPLLSLPASAPSVQSVRGPDAMAHLLHREAHTKWPVGTLSMSHRPSRITNNRHAMQHHL